MHFMMSLIIVAYAMECPSAAKQNSRRLLSTLQGKNGGGLASSHDGRMPSTNSTLKAEDSARFFYPINVIGPEHLHRLVTLVFANACTYNASPDHVVHQADVKLQSIYEQKCQRKSDLRPCPCVFLFASPFFLFVDVDVVCCFRNIKWFEWRDTTSLSEEAINKRKWVSIQNMFALCSLFLSIRLTRPFSLYRNWRTHHWRHLARMEMLTLNKISDLS